MATRLYSLYRKVDGKWKRISRGEYPKRQAVMIYQDYLINSFFRGDKVELRPIPKEKDYGHDYKLQTEVNREILNIPRR
jgi:hypothetical protein